MKGPPSFRLIRTSMAVRPVLVALAALLLAACGGGGGSGQNSNPNVTMSVSPQTLTLSATTTQPAPVNSFQVNVTGLTQNQEVYLGAQFTGQGINQVINNGGTLPATITIQFDSPAALGPGTYDGTVQIEVCFDQACKQPLANSPQSVQVQYTVTKSTFGITSLSPSSAAAGGPSFTLTVTGLGFTQQSTVLWDGSPMPTNFVSGTQLTTQISAAQIASPGTFSVSVNDPVNGTSALQNFTVTPVVLVLSSISPSSVIAGGSSFTLTVTGSGFSQQSTVLWNGNSQPTTFVSATQLTAQISAAEIVAPGSASVTVTDPAASAPSNAETFTITPPVLALNSVSPTSVTVGGPAFMLTVLGTAFTGTSTVEWNGTALATTLVSSTELIAQVPASDISATATASVIVSDPNSPPGTTGAQTVTIAQPSKDAVSFQNNPAHTGAVTFASVSFPSNPTWSVDVGGTPSYALITQGKVIVTVELSGSGSEVLALNQTTGNTVWGPILVSGLANATYDAGRVYVLGSSIGTAATLEALDVNTGALDWSTVLSGQYAFSGAPTAADGMVYAGGAGSGGTLYAVDEATGALLWTQGVMNGDNSTPAVTADGVYVTYPCTTYDIRPATGETIWYNNTGCEGGGGNTPVVANQLLYSPNGVSGYNGDVFNAETEADQGTYVADSPPAFTASMGYFLQSGTLRGVMLANNTVLWSFAGDGQLTGSPIAVNQYVFIGSSSGNLYALDGTTGNQIWNVNLGAAIGASIHALQFSGLAAGDGLLVVPSGTKVTAYALSP